MSWDELEGALEEQRQGVTVDLTKLLYDLWDCQQQERDTAALLSAVEARARVGVFLAFDAASRTQLRDLRPGLRHPQMLTDAAQTLARQRAQVVRDRAEEVLRRATRNMVSPYARLAAQVLVTDAARTGTRAGGIVGDATHKQFTRIRSVKEPRAHSSLEGKVLPVDEPFIIAGLAVHGPGDERLPWSEKAFCGHILRYEKRPLRR